MKPLPLSPFLVRYTNSIRAWDKKHRIVGKSSVEELIFQSLASLESKESDIPPKTKILVDIGAGSGILGVPWLSMNKEHRSVFVEPDPKKSSFLRFYLSSEPELKNRWLVIGEKLEDVSRETLLQFTGDNSLLCASRAFSGSRTLEDCIKDSELCREIFCVFVATDSLSHPFVLKKLSI